MLMNLSKLTLLSILINSTLIVMTSSNFFYSWISMEMNLIAFLPLITKSKNMKEQPMKFFIIQSFSSSMLLMSIICNSSFEPPFSFKIMMMMSMLMKMGMIPFHFWLPSFMSNMNWENCMIMNTWQKIAPTIIFIQLIKFNMMILPMILSLILGPISMFKINSIKKIMAFSSIYNSPWMMCSMIMSKNIFFLFFSIYSMIMIKFMYKMKKYNILYKNQILEKKLMDKSNLTLSILSMSSFPPTLGFFPKWIILQEMVNLSIIISCSMILSSMISMFVYMNMISPVMLTESLFKKYKKNKKFIEWEFSMNILGILIFLILKPL